MGHDWLQLYEWSRRARIPLGEWEQLALEARCIPPVVPGAVAVIASGT